MAKGDDSDCHCITEQGTRYTLALDICLNVAKNGPAYDPFKPERRKDDTHRAMASSPPRQRRPALATAVAGVVPDGIPAPLPLRAGASK
ncbi:hypothetical protein [Luteibacter mycovicinus]|uniref:hypothetical protein n=1 Tax=Luteibacter mycovicinus TaxID=1500890 RepID=UPI0005696524|nr:hypothetical protein [Luteibacter sp. 9143a]